MPKYLCKGSYTVEGVKGVLKEGGSARRDAVAKAAKSVGGKLESLYFALGDTDFYLILDLPDNVTTVAGSIMSNMTGTLKVTYTPLLTPEEMDQSVEMANKMMGAYRPPGA